MGQPSHVGLKQKLNQKREYQNYRVKGGTKSFEEFISSKQSQNKLKIKKNK